MITIVDINSLYPHIIISHNISADTLVGYISGEKDKELKELLKIDDELEDFYQKFAPARTAGRYFGLCYAFNLFTRIKYNTFTLTTAYETKTIKGAELLDFIESNNLIVTINGALFKSNEIGIWPSIEKDLLEKRNYYKKIGDNVKQLSYKILANALYGVYGTTGFIGYNPYIAEAITITGQFITISLSMFINQKMKNPNSQYNINLDDFIEAIRQFDGKTRFLLYRDTDSLFFYNKLKDFNFIDYIAEVGEYLLNNTTLRFSLNKDFFLKYSPKVKLEFEGDVGIFTGRKKRYFIYNKETGKYKITGFLNNSYPQYLNDLIIKTLINIAYNKINKQNKKIYLQKVKEKIKNYLSTDLLEDLYQTVAWKTDNIKIHNLTELNNMDINQAQTYIKSITPNVFSMIVYNTLLDKPLFSYGSKAYSLKAKYNINNVSKNLLQKIKNPGLFNIIIKKITSSNIVAFDNFDAIKPYINEDSISNLIFERIEKYLEENIFEVII